MSIRHDGNKILLKLFSLLLVISCLISLPGCLSDFIGEALYNMEFQFFAELHANKDWSYDLPYGYMISKFDATRTCVVKDEEIFISADVVRFCYNDSYLGAERKMIYSDSQQSNSNLNAKEDSFQIKYYLLEFNTGKCYGPMDEKNYSEKCDELNIENLNEWIDTSPMPEGAYVPE